MTNPRSRASLSISTVPNPFDVTARIVAAGGSEGNHGENLYWCRGLAEDRVGPSVRAEWLTSEGHRDTVLDVEVWVFKPLLEGVKWYIKFYFVDEIWFISAHKSDPEGLP